MTERPSRRDEPLAGQAAVVTGASSGIGAAVARVLAEDGADVAVAARRAERLEEVAADVRDAGGDVEIVPTDVTDPDAVEALVETTVDRFGRLDVAVPNAGVGYNKPVTEMPIEEYDTMRAVNIDGMFYTARAALPHLVESSGHLVFMGSMSGNHPRPNDAAYAATKWWTRGFAASLQGTYGDEDVAVSCINPTEVRTEYGSEDGTAAKEAHEPGSVTEPIEVADAVAYVVRQESPNAITSLDIYRRDKLTHF